MKFSDLLRMSGSNLLRRKLRTALTVLGVVIGTASIVVMISLGLGLQKSSLEQIEQYGGLTTINVNTWGNGEGKYTWTDEEAPFIQHDFVMKPRSVVVFTGRV